MKAACTVILTVFVTWGSSHCQNPFLTSVAVADDARAVVQNPAGLGVSRNLNSIFRLHHSRKEVTSWSFLSQTNLGGFGYERRRQFPEYSRFIWGFGGTIAKGTYFGVRFIRTYWPEEAHNSFDAGLLWRPTRSVSLGVVSNYLNEPGEFKRVHTAGIGLRPLSNRFTLFFDASLGEDEELKDGHFLCGGEVEPVDGVLLHGSIDDEKCFKIGMVLSVPSFSGGYTSGFNSSAEYTSGSFGTALSQETYRTVLRGRHGFVDLEISGRIVDEKPTGVLAVLLSGGGTPMKEIIDVIDKVRKDDSVDGVLVRLGGLEAGWGSIQEIRSSLSELRRSGKLVVCYLEGGGNSQYYLASVADRILLNPGGFLLLCGLRTEVLFLKDTLEKLGIKADLEHTGDYKTASDLLTRNSMTKAHREMENAILDDLYSQLVQGIAEGRQMSREEVLERIDGGPYMSREAYEVGLADSLVYEDEIEETIRRLNGGKYLRIEGTDFAGKQWRDYDWGSRPKIALIYGSGVVVSGESGYNPFLFGKYMGSKTIAGAIRQARKDPSVRAIVLRVNSPGGSGLAGDVIWREVVLAQEEKPVVVSMGDVAASAGYHISCGAGTIVAEPGTITGSIGAIAGKLDMHALYDKLGMKKEIITRGKHAAMFSDYREFTPEERDILRELLDEDYRLFVQKVADGRGMEWEDVDAIARGRVWTGNQAVGNGLVDVLGGLKVAIEIAKEKADISPGEDVELVVLPAKKGLLGEVFSP